MPPTIKIVESYHRVKLLREDGRSFAAEVFGTGRYARVEIVEIDAEGRPCAARRSYEVNNSNLTWRTIVARYAQDAAIPL